MRGEQKRATKYFNRWKGVVNRSARNALPNDAWYYLENMQPIGDGNNVPVANISSMLVDFGASLVYASTYINILGTDYLITVTTDGKAFAYNIGSNTNTQIATGLSGAGTRIAQWKNQQALFIDSTGYFHWDGTTYAAITGTGVPTAGTDIAVAFGRVWIVNGRLLSFSGADMYDATAWTVANGSGAQALTDPTLRNAVTRLLAANGYLYIVGPSSVAVISDVYVPSGANPPTPLYSNLSVQSIIGSDQPFSFFAFNRMVMFANRYGAWAMSGVQAQRISEDIDNTWKYVDFNQQISAGQVVSNNILCAAFLIKRLNDPVFGSNQVLAMYSDEKWWFANYGTVSFIVSAIAGNIPSIFGFITNKLYKLFSDYTTAPATTSMTPLWAMDDPLSDKEIIRAGFEATVRKYSGTFQMNIDTVNSSSVAIPNVNLGSVQLINNFKQPVSLINNYGAYVQLFSGTYLLYNSDAPGTFQKFVGATIKSSGCIYQLSAIYMDYKLRARWTGG